MDVRCTRCGTEYEFDDALISERGTSVRCTQCGFQFKVFPPKLSSVGPDEWVVLTSLGRKVIYRSLRELQNGISKSEVAREDLLARGSKPPRPLGSIAELEPLFATKAGPERQPSTLTGVAPPPAANTKNLPPPGGSLGRQGHDTFSGVAPASQSQVNDDALPPPGGSLGRQGHDTFSGVAPPPNPPDGSVQSNVEVRPAPPMRVGGTKTVLGIGASAAANSVQASTTTAAGAAIEAPTPMVSPIPIDSDPPETRSFESLRPDEEPAQLDSSLLLTDPPARPAPPAASADASTARAAASTTHLDARPAHQDAPSRLEHTVPIPRVATALGVAPPAPGAVMAPPAPGAMSTSKVEGAPEREKPETIERGLGGDKPLAKVQLTTKAVAVTKGNGPVDGASDPPTTRWAGAVIEENHAQPKPPEPAAERGKPPAPRRGEAKPEAPRDRSPSATTETATVATPDASASEAFAPAAPTSEAAQPQASPNDAKSAAKELPASNAAKSAAKELSASNAAQELPASNAAKSAAQELPAPNDAKSAAQSANTPVRAVEPTDAAMVAATAAPTLTSQAPATARSGELDAPATERAGEHTAPKKTDAKAAPASQANADAKRAVAPTSAQRAAGVPAGQAQRAAGVPAGQAQRAAGVPAGQAQRAAGVSAGQARSGAVQAVERPRATPERNKDPKAHVSGSLPPKPLWTPARIVTAIGLLGLGAFAGMKIVGSQLGDKQRPIPTAAPVAHAPATVAAVPSLASLPTATAAWAEPVVECLRIGDLSGAEQRLAAVSSETRDATYRALQVRTLALSADLVWWKVQLIGKAAGDSYVRAKQQLGERIERLKAELVGFGDEAGWPEPVLAASLDARRLQGDKEEPTPAILERLKRATSAELKYTQLVSAWVRAGQPDEATIDGLTRLRSTPTDLGPRPVALLMALVQLNRIEDAKGELKRYAAETPTHPLLAEMQAYVSKAEQSSLADAQQDAGSPESAAGDPDLEGDFRLRLTRASECLSRNELTRAQKLLRSVLAERPNDTEAITALADVYRRRGDLAQSRNLYDKALSLNGNYLPAMSGAADLRWRSGDRAGAASYYRRILDRVGETPGYGQVAAARLKELEAAPKGAAEPAPPAPNTEPPAPRDGKNFPTKSSPPPRTAAPKDEP